MTVPRADADVVIYPSRHGNFAHYTSDEGIGQFLRLYGEWAEDEIALLRPYIPRDGTVIDVGANIGTHTVAFAQMVGRGGLVIAIEGQASVYKMLAYNVVSNGAADFVWPINAIAGSAVTLTRYSIAMHRGLKNYGLTHFRDLASLGGDGGAAIQMPVVTIDSLNLQKCDLIKIDVEGMELPVLQGATHTLASLGPIVYFEQSPGFTINFTEIYALLSSLNYRLYWHVANPFNRDNYHGAKENIFGGGVEVNIFACPEKGPMPELPRINGPAYEPPIPPKEESLRGVSLPFEPESEPLLSPKTWPVSPVTQFNWGRMKQKIKSLTRDFRRGFRDRSNRS